jgi:hypothetical protein
MYMTGKDIAGAKQQASKGRIHISLLTFQYTIRVSTKGLQLRCGPQHNCFVCCQNRNATIIESALPYLIAILRNIKNRNKATTVTATVI